MSKKCHQCGQELADDLNFCTSCGAKQDMQSYPIIKKYRTQSIIGILGGLSIGTISIHGLIREITHPIFDGYHTTTLITGIFISVVCLIWLLRSLGNLSQRFYVVNCPYCNQQALFPIEEQGINCSCCDKRIIMINGKVQKVEEDTNHENM